MNNLPHEWTENYSIALKGMVPFCKHCGINTTHANANRSCPARAFEKGIAMHETKLGQLIDANAGRDAVHVALAPMQAKQRLDPGEHFGFDDPNNQKLASKFAAVKIGIVDPYLTKPVEPEEWFYGCLYPQTTTGLRHVWTHPAFAEVANRPPVLDAKAASVAWLEKAAAACDCTYIFLMESAEKWVQYQDHTIQNDSQSWRDGFPEAQEFWKHYEIVTGVKWKEPNDTFFCCTC